MSNRVDHLLIRPFEAHSFAEKMEIKRLGPHQPIDIVIQQINKPITLNADQKKDKRHCNRSFVVSWFSKVKWLTVSELRKGLYCFPCVLFGNDTTWARTGFYDLKHLSERIRRHECSSSHINNCLQLKLFGQVDLSDELQTTTSSSSCAGGPTTSASSDVCKVEADHHVGDVSSSSSSIHHLPQTYEYADGIEAMLLAAPADHDQQFNNPRLTSSSSSSSSSAASRSNTEERHKAHVQRHNVEVDRKHCVLSKLVDCILFCFSSGLPLKLSSSLAANCSGSAASTVDQVDQGSYRPPRQFVFSALLHFTATVDHQLGYSLQGSATSSSSSFLTDTVYNELLDAMLEVYREELAREVSATRYVSILMEDFTELLGQGRTAIVIRYLTADRHELVERLWGLLDDPVDEADFAEVVAKHFGRYNLDTKLIAHAHNGMFVNCPSMQVGGHVRMNVKDRFQKLHPFACYVQSYVKPLTITLCNACSTIEPIRVFFANLSSFPAFFSAASRRASVLAEIGDGLRLSPLDENLVATVFENRKTLLHTCVTILEGDNWDAESIHGASVLQELLYSARFSFFLKFFHLVMPFADIIHRKFMMTDLTESSARNALKNFTTAIEWISVNEIDAISRSTTEASVLDNSTSANQDQSSSPSPSSSPSKKTRLDESVGEPDENWRQAAREACNVMIADVDERFRCVSHLLAFQLVDAELFESYGLEFPDEKLRAVDDVFLRAIVSRKLKIELQTLYKNSAFRFPPGLMATLDFINRNDLREDFSETCKLLELAVTSPVATLEVDRCFDTLARTKSCLQLNTEDHDDVTTASVSAERLTAIAVVTVEVDFIRSMSNFTEAVIDRFSSREHRRAAFIHKKQPLPVYRKSQANFSGEQKFYRA